MSDSKERKKSNSHHCKDEIKWDKCTDATRNKIINIDINETNETLEKL